MGSLCWKCAFCYRGNGSCRLGVKDHYNCARFQPDPEYVAQVNAQATEESQRRLQEEQHKHAVELQRQQDAREEAKRKEEEKRRRKEAARLRAAERRENYKEINDEPYTPMAVRAAIGILPHLFKKK